MEQGLHEMSESDYHSLPMEIVSNSYLSRLDKCPANARTSMEDSPTLLLGRAVHSYVLEGKEAFEERFAVAPICDRRKKEGKDIWAEFVEESEGKDVLKTEDYVIIHGIDSAVKSHPFAAQLLANGMPEQTAIWVDKDTGITCKCRPDWVPFGHNILVDLKTAKDSGEYGFAKSVGTYRYFQQAAFYKDGISQAMGEQFDSFVFIAVEKIFPFRTEVYAMDPDYLAYGRAEYHRLLKLEAECRDKGRYDHFSESGCGELYIPAYLGAR